MHRIALLGLALAAAPCAAAPPDGQSWETSGAGLYAQFCASCHGTAGEGHGPVAPSLRTPPPDLTRISERRGGKFPTAEIEAVIDGRAAPPAHGPREMPVWGYEFEAMAPEPAPGRATAQAMTARVVAYLRSIQR